MHILKEYKLTFDCINNMVVYEALFLGLMVSILLKVTNIEIYGDYKLLVNEVNDVYNKNNKNLIPYKVLVEDIL